MRQPLRPSIHPRAPRTAAAALLALGASGCVGDKVLKIDSRPTGASVRLDDTLVGVTPLELPMEHYGRRRLALYKEGYRTYAEPLTLDPPWWARFPVDIFTEVLLPLGLDDVREIEIDLVADTGTEARAATADFMDHALRARAGEDLRGEPIAGAAKAKAPEVVPE